MKSYVLDTSALLALRGNEPGADRVEAILRNIARAPVLVSFITRMELLYRVTRDEDEEAARNALRVLDAIPIRWISCEPAILEQAARIKARERLSVADAWIAATATCNSAVLVHKDPEFRSVDGLRYEELA